MANVIITSPESNLTTVVFRNMTNEQAKTIADHMNNLNKVAANHIGKTIQLVFKVISK